MNKDTNFKIEYDEYKDIIAIQKEWEAFSKAFSEKLKQMCDAFILQRTLAEGNCQQVFLSSSEESNDSTSQST